MAEYNRFVSYIYTYEKGVKATSSGFVRVEVRDKRCSLHLTLNHISVATLLVYMFVRKGQVLKGIFMGEIHCENRTATYTDTVDVDNVKDSGYTLDQVAGMIVTDEGRQVWFGTGWDDETLDMSAFEPVTKVEQDIVLQEAAVEVEIQTEPVVELAAQTEPPESVVETVIQTETIAESTVRTESPETIAEGSVRTEPPEAAAEGSVRTDQPEPVTESTVRTESKAEFPTGRIREPVSSEMPQGGNPKLLEREQGSSTKLSQEPPVELPQELTSEPIQEPAVSNPGTEVAPVAAPSYRDRLQMSYVDYYEKALNQCPPMYPFEESWTSACVSLEPEDMGRLPMHYWSLGHNSFVLHGFYSYRHLLLAKVEPQPDKAGVPQYIIGVPGLNRHNEGFMARQFGFNHFKSVRKGKAAVGDFGYWYRILDRKPAGKDQQVS